MRFLLARCNLMHNRIRTLVILSGIVFSILLLFMQMGFYNACKINSTMIYDMFRFDVVLLAPYYVFIDDAGTLPLYRAAHAESIQSVASAQPLFLSTAMMRNPVTGAERSIMAIGVDIAAAPFNDPSKNRVLSRLKSLDSTLIDRNATLDYGPLPIGALTELNGRRIHISGDYTNGAGFISGGSILMSDETFSRVMNVSRLSPNAVLVRFLPGTDPKSVLAQMKKKLTGDVRVMTREELNQQERHFFMSVNPIGIMFTSGAVIAFLVGSVILYQILATEVIHHMKEYATLKAMGYTGLDLKLVVMAQGILMTVAGFIPSAGAALYLYKFLRQTIQIPVYMTPDLLGLIFSASLAMSVLSGILAVRRIETADPAELF